MIRILRAIASALLLAVIVAGVPLALWRLGGTLPPVSVESWQDLWHLLTSQDRGHVFPLVATGAGWVCWAVLTCSILIETMTLALGRTVSVLPGLGLPRRCAAVLLMTIVAAVTTSQVHAGPGGDNAAREPNPQAQEATGSPAQNSRAASDWSSSGTGGLLAASVIGLLETKRTLARRTLTPGQRLWAPPGEDAQLENELRHNADGEAAECIDYALRQLSRWCREQGRALPQLAALRNAGPAIRLYLAQPDELPAEWEPNATGDVWSMRVPPEALITATESQDSSPWPCLVTVGQDQRGATVLLELETIRQLRVAGDRLVLEEILRAMVMEIATSPWGGKTRLTLVGVMPELAAALPAGQVRYVPTLTQAMDDLRATSRSRTSLINAAGASSIGQLRGEIPAGSAWSADLVVLGPHIGAEEAILIASIAEQTPRVGVVALGVNLTCQSRIELTSPAKAHLYPSGITVRPQLLDERTYRGMLDLLTMAEEVSSGPSWAANLAEDEGDLTSLGDLQSPLASLAAVDAIELPVPTIRFLGPVEVESDEPGTIGSGHVGQATELLAYLALNTGATGRMISDALWPGTAASASTRNAAVSRARRLLGPDSERRSRLEYTAGDGGRYWLRGVRSDWDGFLAAIGPDITAAPTSALRGALALVRGVPLKGAATLRAGGFGWAQADAHAMSMAISDVAHTVASRAMAHGDIAVVTEAAQAGLRGAPDDERLWRWLIRAHLYLGQTGEASDAVAALNRRLADLGASLQADTRALLDSART